MSKTKTKIILDTDPGIDDAIAILLACASSEIELLGLTVNFGNSFDMSKLVRNARNVLSLGGRPDVPVYAGAASSIEGRFDGEHETFVHGANGLGGVEIPDSQAPEISDETAASFIVRSAKEYPGEITLVAVAPLTNVALALNLCPDLPKILKKLVIMGGSLWEGGNISPCSEANFFNDPVSARRVIRSKGWTTPPVIVPLDLTHKISVTEAEFEAYGKSQKQCGRFVQDIGIACCRAIDSTGIALHDPAAMAYAIDPALFKEPERYRMDILVDGIGKGAVLVDKRYQRLRKDTKLKLKGGEDWPEIDVLLHCGGSHTLITNFVKSRILSLS